MSELASSIQNLFKNSIRKLTTIYPAGEACAMADRLFEHYFHLSPSQRVLSGNSNAGSDEIRLLEDAVNKLLSHEPLQYILGTAFFMDMEFEVNSSVLIPRPETEELVTLILKSLKENSKRRGIRILDIGTGSGCIAISLKKYLPEASVAALDISGDAIRVAKANAIKNDVSVDFIEADILDQFTWQNFQEVDLIVSNPPYVAQAEKQLMHPNVLEHEPHTALFVPDEDPLVFYRAIFGFSKSKLCKGGTLWFEINESFGNEIMQLSLSQGLVNTNIFFDFHGKSRFLHCFK